MSETIQQKGYIKTPYRFFNEKIQARRPRRSEIALAGMIYTFSNIKEHPEARCNLSFKKFADKLGTSPATIARGISALKESGLVEQDKARYACASYKYAETVNDKAYIRVDLFLYSTVFEIHGSEPRRLRRSEIDVFSLISSHCNNKKRNGTFKGSMRSIAAILNMNEKTVRKAIDVLLHADLIYRTAEDKGLNKYVQSVYRINAKYVRKAQKAYDQKERKQEKPLPKATIDANARAERQRYYDLIKDQEQARRDKLEALLMRDREYAQAKIELRKIEISLAKADLAGNVDLLRTLNHRKIELLRVTNERMRACGVPKDALEIRYVCKKCKDTGTLPDGRSCDCYRQGKV